MDQQDRFRGCLLGLATGDAVGTTNEFTTKGKCRVLTDMEGGGPFHLKPGQWTDDTSMALCLATSLLEKQGFDAGDQMERYYNWLEKAYLSSTGRYIDSGDTVRAAVGKYRATGNPFSGSTSPDTAGNGSIMRLAPIPMFYFRQPDAIAKFAAESSRTTHGAPECLDACRLLAGIIFRALSGLPREEVLFADANFAGEAKIKAIALGGYRGKPVGDIKGTGYVVPSLEAALWCFLRTDGFEQAILTAANLGGDADTTAAVCGQVAGAYYGASGIPERWLSRLTMRREITELADRLHGAGPSP